MGPWLNSCGSCNTLVVFEWGKVGRWDDGGCVAGELLFFEADDRRVLAHVIISHGVMDELFWLLLIGFFLVAFSGLSFWLLVLCDAKYSVGLLYPLHGHRGSHLRHKT